MTTTKEEKRDRLVSLRIPEDLRKWLKHRAVEHDRSLTSEILAVLRDHQMKTEASHAT